MRTTSDPLTCSKNCGKDNQLLVANIREARALRDDKGDLAGASLLENWIDEGERRVSIRFETTRHGG